MAKEYFLYISQVFAKGESIFDNKTATPGVEKEGFFSYFNKCGKAVLSASNARSDCVLAKDSYFCFCRHSLLLSLG